MKYFVIILFPIFVLLKLNIDFLTDTIWGTKFMSAQYGEISESLLKFESNATFFLSYLIFRYPMLKSSSFAEFMMYSLNWA